MLKWNQIISTCNSYHLTWKIDYERDFVQTNKTLVNKLNKPNANNIKTIDTNLIIFQRVFQNMFFLLVLLSSRIWIH